MKRLFLSVTMLLLMCGCGDASVLVLSQDGNMVQKSDLVTAVGSTDTIGKTILITSAQTLTDNLTIPATIAVKCEKGGVISISSAKTLTINGPFDAGLYQAFGGDGTVTFGAYTDRLQAEWYGNLGDGTTDNTAARNRLMRSAIASAGRRIVYGPGIFVSDGWETDLATNPWSMIIEGQSPTGTQLKLKANATKDMFAINKGQTNPGIWPSYWAFKNIMLDGNKANNTIGTGLWMEQVNEFVLDNVNMQNFKEHSLYGLKVLGLEVRGKSIWSGTDGDGVYFKNSSELTINGVAVQGTATTANAMVIEKEASYSNAVTATFNQFYLEDNKNGIKFLLDGSGAGAEIVFNQPTIIGLGAAGGTAFDITADSASKIRVRGGTVYNAWSNRFTTNSGATNVWFEDVNGISNEKIYQLDRSGVKLTYGDYITENLFPNGDFSWWSIGNFAPVDPQAGGAGVTDPAGNVKFKDTVDYHSEPAGYKLTGGTVDPIKYYYVLTADELRRARGKYIQVSAWVKGTAANSAYIEITSYGGAAPVVDSVFNSGTDWERLRNLLLVPSDSTALRIDVIVASGKTATIDDITIGLNYAGAYSPKRSTEANARGVGSQAAQVVELSTSSNTTFGPYDGEVFVLTMGASGKTFNPSGTFATGTTIHVYAISNSVTFDSTGINTLLAAGKHGIFHKISSGWIGGQVD